MKTSRPILLATLVLVLVLSACAAPATPEATATRAATSIPPTLTPEPTLTPTATPLPGQVVVPLELLAFGYSWLPLDRAELPLFVYYGFKLDQPPFDVPQVRQAFAAALDTEKLTQIYATSTFYNNEVSTRTIVPPGTLSRDLSGEIGLPYDPALARQLLMQAGYTDPATFPLTKLLVVYPRNADYPGIMVNAANEAIRMWQENLGVSVTLDVVGVGGGLAEQLTLINSGEYQMFEHGVWAGANDPREFMDSMFLPYGANNLTGFNDDRVSLLINTANQSTDPAVRLPLYLELERLLSEDLLPVIPIFHGSVDGSQW